ncbi:DNA (cytosine-5-)-methyltransferase [Sulfitobacter sp.]|uniref:DNA (cytosine-5-)-methyltransferase n=1 Tax=Sulfitobacter sp. TaxID=1903071 RepID=UPI00300382BB
MDDAYPPEVAELISSIELQLEGTEFSSEAVAIATQYLHSGTKFPDVDYASYEDVPNQLSKEVESAAKFSFIDLFAGIGGFRLALNAEGGRAVFSSEWEKNAKSAYFINHGEYPYGDINLFTNEGISDNRLGALIPSHDILAGGFPCQPFSLAGVSARNSLGTPHGLDCTTQGTLFRSIERIAAVKQPKVLFLENVRNILSHDNGRTFEVIKNSIEATGYKFFFKVVDSSTVVAQQRKRCFMVAVRKDVARKHGDFVFPAFEGDPIPLKSVLRQKVDDRYTISQKLWDGHKNRSDRNKARGTGFTVKLADVERPSATIVARYGKDGKECLIKQENGPPRTLSIEECRELFGYPEDFKLPLAKTTSFRLLGNSVVVPVVSIISKAIVQQYL